MQLTRIVSISAAPGYNEKTNASLLWPLVTPTSTAPTGPNWNDMLLDIYANYSDVISAHFYGHEHSGKRIMCEHVWVFVRECVCVHTCVWVFARVRVCDAGVWMCMYDYHIAVSI